MSHSVHDAFEMHQVESSRIRHLRDDLLMGKIHEELSRCVENGKSVLTDGERALYDALSVIPENHSRVFDLVNSYEEWKYLFDDHEGTEEEEKALRRLERMKKISTSSRIEREISGGISDRMKEFAEREKLREELTQAGPVSGQVWSVKRDLGAKEDEGILPIANPTYVFVMSMPQEIPGSVDADAWVEIIPITMNTQWITDADLYVPAGNEWLHVDHAFLPIITGRMLTRSLDKCWGKVSEEVLGDLEAMIMVYQGLTVLPENPTPDEVKERDEYHARYEAARVKTEGHIRHFGYRGYGMVSRMYKNIEFDNVQALSELADRYITATL